MRRAKDSPSRAALNSLDPPLDARFFAGMNLLALAHQGDDPKAARSAVGDLEQQLGLRFRKGSLVLRNDPIAIPGALRFIEY